MNEASDSTPHTSSNSDEQAWTELHSSIAGLSNHSLDLAIETAVLALDAAQRAFPRPHRNLVVAYETAADLYRRRGDYEMAHDCYREAIAIGNDILPSDLALMARLVVHIAEVTQALGLFGQAIVYYEQAIPLMEKVHGPDMPEMLLLLNSVALLCKEAGQTQKAERYFRRALEVYERRRGSQHPYVADMLNNLGTLYFANGDYPEAEDMHLRALSIRETAFGDNHPDVAQSLGNLAAAYHMDGNLEAAARYYDKALTIYEKQLDGVSDNDFLVVAQNFADLLRQIGKPEQADGIDAQVRAFQENA